ncbi:MAG: DUF1858 domain-containing protein [Brevinema sp.]
MQHTIYFNKTLHEQCLSNPELRDLLFELGFTHIKDDEVFNSVGKVMTIAKAITMGKQSREHVVSFFTQKGYLIEE